MRGDAESTEAPDVLEDGVGRAAERIRRTRHVDRDIMSLFGADLHTVETQHAVDIGRWIGWARAVAMVRHDDELQAGARCGPRDGGLVAVAVGPRGVNVIRAGDGARGDLAPA
jgi:hypothetical protein